METVSQVSSSIGSAAQAVSESASQSFSPTLQSTPAIGGSTPISEFSILTAFDPSVIEKPPTGIGKINIFKDTNVVASASPQIVGIENDPEFDFKSVKPPAKTSTSYNFQIKPSKIPDFFENLTFEDIELSESVTLDAVEKQRKLDAIEESRKFAGLNYEDIMTTPTTDVPVDEVEPIKEPEKDEPVIIIEEEHIRFGQNKDQGEEENEDEDDVDEEADYDETISELDPNEAPFKGDPDSKQGISQMYVVDADAQEARMNEIRLIIDSIETVDTNTTNEYISRGTYKRPVMSEISGEKVTKRMHKIPTIDQISEVLLEKEMSADGSYIEAMEEIGNQTFTDKMTAKEKIFEIIRNKPAIMLSLAGKAVNEFDVQRVYKFLNLGKYQTSAALQSIRA